MPRQPGGRGRGGAAGRWRSRAHPPPPAFEQRIDEQEGDGEVDQDAAAGRVEDGARQAGVRFEEAAELGGDLAQAVGRDVGEVLTPPGGAGVSLTGGGRWVYLHYGPPV